MFKKGNESIRMLRRVEVQTKTGLGRSAIYDRINPDSRYYDPEFPKPVKLGNGKNPPVGWVESEVDEYLRKRVLKSRSPA